MKIAFVTFEYPPFIMGGAGIYAKMMTYELAKLGHQVVVFTPNVLGCIFKSNLYNLDIHYVSVNKKLPFKALQFWLRLPKEIKKSEEVGQFDIIHFNGLSYWFLKSRLSKAKCIVTVHHLFKDAIKNNNLNFVSRMKDLSGENNLFLSFLENKCFKSSDKLIAVSNFTKKQIIESYHINPDKIEVVYNGIDLNLFSYTEKEIAKAKKQLNLDKRPVILFVGRVDDPRKGLDFLLLSLKEVLNVVDVTLLVVGKGNQIEVRKFISSLGISNNVVFTGFIDENLLKIYYSLCDIYVCPSKLEGFGLTLLEAMVAGKPIVATKVGAIPEIVKENVNGILVEPDDIVSMSNAIITLLQNEDLSIDIRNVNVKYVTSNFSWAKSAKKIEEIYTICQVSNSSSRCR